MAIKKTELYSSLWKSCDELRGSMDASQYKDYVLILLFLKYVTDKYYKKDDAIILVPTGGSFHDLVKLKNNKDIGEGLNQIIAKLAESNQLDVIKATDFADENKLGKGKEMIDRLTKLVSIFENPALDFGKNTAEGDDILGDAYEYLMRHFATESGKSKGQFYTPAEVSRVIAKIIGIKRTTHQTKTVYDPTCGSGSLLLKAADEAANGLSIFGQEKDNTTAGLAKMNMILHGDPYAEIKNADTITNPQFLNDRDGLKRFDFVVANPPFSTKSWSNGIIPSEDKYNRFEFGIPPAKNGDYAFLLHILASLKNDGKGAVVLPHGVLFRGNAEARIRENLIRRGLIKGIIGLPTNLFFGTGIPACIIVLDKENAHARKGIFMIDASKGFMKDGNKNRLREQDIRKIVDTFNQRLEITKYSRMIGIDEIESNEFNLNIPRYIDTQEDEDIQDILAHLKGGIPKADIDDLEHFWKVFPTLRKTLFSEFAQNAGYKQLNINVERLKLELYSHPDFTKYALEVDNCFANWRKNNEDTLSNISDNDHPKDLLKLLADDILVKFSELPLIDKYDVYQSLMDYWHDTMQDDVYFLVYIGWKIVLEPVKISKKVTRYICELIPDSYMHNRYFKEQKDEIDLLQDELEELNNQKLQLEEENAGEEDVFDECRPKDKITKTALNATIKKYKTESGFEEELEILLQYAVLLEKESKTKKAIKEKEQKLYEMTLKKYRDLSVDEIKDIVINDKWMTALNYAVNEEMERLSSFLSRRMKELYTRYETTLPELENEVKTLTKKVNSHLKKMGFKW
ncbi:MAG: type I restriction-modification system subunit M [Candidatus Cloacimonetes bacterium]|nr:type I restriction-modification system subunit M [Candidatus Cloacimonadota bacterium]